MKDRLPWVFLIILILFGMASAIGLLVVALKNAPEQVPMIPQSMTAVEESEDD